MTIAHTKSSYITNQDATPPVENTGGEGAGARLKVIEGTITALASSSLASTYQFVRVPSNCKVKKIFFESAAQTAGVMNIGLYYATDGQGGRPTSLLAANTISSVFFATAIDVGSAVTITDITNQTSSTYTQDLRSQPLWAAAGLTTDPGGSFDITGTVSSVISTGTGVIGLTVFYTD
jgi:hypothetical protein